MGNSQWHHDQAFGERVLREHKEQAEKLATLRPEVVAFAVEMERVLRRHDHKGGWDHCTPAHLSRRLREELDELVDAVKSGQAPEKILDEAVDVANFAMMVADVVGGLMERGER